LASENVDSHRLSNLCSALQNLFTLGIQSLNLDKHVAIVHADVLDVY